LAGQARGVVVGAIAATTLLSFTLAAPAQQPAASPSPARPAIPRPPPATVPRPPAAGAVKPAARAAPRPAPAGSVPATVVPAPFVPPATSQTQAVPAPPADTPPLIYSPWNKFCLKGDPPNPREACFTGRDARTEEGQLVTAAALIEPEGGQKVLRVTLPVSVLLSYGARIVIDRDAALTAPYLFCSAQGCFAEFEGTADLIAKLKKGQTLVLQAVNLADKPLSLPLALSDSAGNSFARANEGPPTAPKVFEEQQKKLQEELQKRADEARKRLESQSGGAGGAPR
jgi:invasion protein IalB